MASVSGFLRTVGQVAGVVAGIALVGSGIGAALGGTMILAGVGSAASIATVASAVSAVTMAGAQLVYNGPNAVGQVNQRIIGANNPQPYAMGRVYSGGVQVHDVGWGGEIDDVKNPYRFLATVHSCCGPIDGFETTLIDWAPTSFPGGEAAGYYENYFYRDSQLGARPEADALSPHWAGTPDWGSDYKLSGYAATGYSLEWSKKGKRFPGGQIPVIGEVLRGVKAYDPRLDSTYPGGSGGCRLGDEATYVYTANPALHAGTYGYGRWVNGKKVFGIDLGPGGIDFADIVAWANACEANDWIIGGIVYEPGDKWNNVKRIAQAGGGRPLLTGGQLRFTYLGPRTSLATITRDDLADGALRGGKGPGWKSRHNTIVPRYRSEAHQWNYVQSVAVSVAAFVTADGEAKTDEVQFDFVTEKDQAAQLALYEVWERREKGPFVLQLKPHMRIYDLGDCLTLGADLGLEAGDVKATVRRKRVDPTSGIVTLTLQAESDAKHGDALGATGTAPPVVTLPTSEELEGVGGGNTDPAGYERTMIQNRTMTDIDPADGILQATSSAITAETHTSEYNDRAVSVTGATITLDVDGVAIAASTRYYVSYDDAPRLGGAVTFVAYKTPTAAANSAANPSRHYVGTIVTDAPGGTGTSGGGSTPPGWDRDDYYIV